MIGWFPILYPDETFNSLCYRYAERMKYPCKTAFGRDLFGEEINRMAVDVPRRLAFFISHFPPGSPMTAVDIIQNHSFLPYYRPFLRAEIYAQMTDQIMGEHVKLNVLGALSKFRKHVPTYLSYCPVCVATDRQIYGETYWHRQHQLPGVHICAEHAVWLEKSRIYAKHRDFTQGPVTAEEAIQNIHLETRPIDASLFAQRLFCLSQNSSWILTHQPNLDAEGLFQKYCGALREKGYLSQRGMNQDKLPRDILDYYSHELLVFLGCGFLDQFQQHLRWVNRLTSHYHRARFSPLYHLLLIQFLGESASQLFTLPDERHPFGDGPWPCLNRTCTHYRQPIITDCQVYYIKNRPRAEFQCECGFAYRRWAVDRAEDSCYVYDRVVVYGKVWDEKFRELWNNGSISINAIKKSLGIANSNTLKYHAIRLGLSLEKDRNLLPVSPEFIPKESIDEVRQRRILVHRKWVLDMLRENPMLTRKQLAEKDISALVDLRKFDREWLDCIVPVTKPSSQVKINWLDRDESLSKMIPAVADVIRSEPGKPARITKTEIGRRIGAKPWFYNELCKTPMTKGALNESIESGDTFAIRRLLWARDYFIQQNETPSQSSFMRKAGVERRLYPGLNVLVNSLLAEIQKALEKEA